MYVLFLYLDSFDATAFFGYDVEDNACPQITFGLRLNDDWPQAPSGTTTLFEFCCEHFDIVDSPLIDVFNKL